LQPAILASYLFKEEIELFLLKIGNKRYIPDRHDPSFSPLLTKNDAAPIPIQKKIKNVMT